jgi:hypothetical protein
MDLNCTAIGFLSPLFSALCFRYQFFSYKSSADVKTSFGALLTRKKFNNDDQLPFNLRRRKKNFDKLINRLMMMSN